MDKNLACASLHILQRDLCFNICKLESSYLCNSEVSDMGERIKNNILPHLSYSCKFWTKHLQCTSFVTDLALQVKNLLASERILFWWEVLSLLDALGNVAANLASTARWLQCEKTFDDVAALARDGVKFIRTFANAIAKSTPHLYISALPMTPSNSLLSRMLCNKFCNMAKVVVGHTREWPSVEVELTGHTDEVMSVAFSPDGTRIISGSHDNTVRVWDAEKGKGVQIGRPLEGHSNGVTSVAFSPDGTRIIAGLHDHTVRVWDTERGVQIGSPLQGHSSWVTSVAFSPDGTRIISGSSDKTLRVWDAERDQVKLHKDGWIRGCNNALLLWIPPALQRPFYSMHTILVIPKGGCAELDLSKMSHGIEWQNCFRGTP
ncbi:hypothetical protein ID866_7480 [Astraeus odoratus]|nr:hypothetical protein ID866_7480 [Astraeus odoratus]